MHAPRRASAPLTHVHLLVSPYCGFSLENREGCFFEGFRTPRRPPVWCEWCTARRELTCHLTRHRAMKTYVYITTVGESASHPQVSPRPRLGDPYPHRRSPPARRECLLPPRAVALASSRAATSGVAPRLDDLLDVLVILGPRVRLAHEQRDAAEDERLVMSDEW